MMSVKLRVFGVGLIVFYVAGSRATKVGKTIKSKLEDTSDAAGYRTAFQVGTRFWLRGRRRLIDGLSIGSV